MTITNYTLSNKIKKILFSALLIVTTILLTSIQLKTNSILNILHDGHQILNSSNLRRDFLNSSTAVLLMDYFKWPNEKACERVGYYGGVVTKVGNQALMDGQKAICLDNGIGPKVDNCLVYSIGINNEWSFDEAMASYGCQVYSFDPSMDLKAHNRTSKIHFYPIGLSSQNGTLIVGKGGKQLHLKKMNATTVEIMTLSSIYRMLSPMNGENAIIDYLKIDIDWEEWNVIPDLIESGILGRIRQMGMEIHLSKNENKKLSEFQKEAQLLHRLEEEGGMIRFDSKINGFSFTTFKEMNNLKSYFAYEIAWYNRKFSH